MSSPNKTLPAPYIVAPTYDFDGDDGQWSTFAIEVGTPPQTFRVLPGTVGPNIWLPTIEGCEGGSVEGVADCGDLRGANDYQGKASHGFQSNESSSWAAISGPYVLSEGQNLFGSNDTAVLGLDTVALGETSAKGYGTQLEQQLIAGIAQAYFWVGGLGLGSWPVTFGGGSSYRGLMTAMKNNSLIPSLSYGYTAGQSYASPAVSGSLVLGGYDEDRLDMTTSPPPVSLPINASTEVQTLQLGLQTISATNTLGGATRRLLAEPITANIDSGISQLWLPAEACDLFEQAFGLQYLSEANYYVYPNDTIHKQMQDSKPTLSFSVGNLDGSTSINIQFPYSAFDQDLTIPLYNGTYPYFPLRQAANESQYTLGRVFLQEAYIIVDWENANLTIGQTIPQNSTTHVRAILPPSSTASTAGVAATSAAAATHKGLATGAIAGMAIVMIALIAAAVGFGIFYLRRKRRAAARVSRDHGRIEAAAPEVHNGALEDYYPPEKDGKSPYAPFVHIDEVRPGLDSRKTSELDNMHQIHEMAGATLNRELMSTPVFELEGQVGTELEARRAATVRELSADKRSVKSLPRSPTVDESSQVPPLPCTGGPMPISEQPTPFSEEPTPMSEGMPSPPLPSPPFDSDASVISPRNSEVPVSSVRSSDVPLVSARSSGAPLLSPPLVSPMGSHENLPSLVAHHGEAVVTKDTASDHSWKQGDDARPP